MTSRTITKVDLKAEPAKSESANALIRDPIHKVGAYEVQVVRHETVEHDSVLVTVYRRKAFVEMVAVPVEGFKIAALKRRVLSLRGCRDTELRAVVNDARKLVRTQVGGPAR